MSECLEVSDPVKNYSVQTLTDFSERKKILILIFLCVVLILSAGTAVVLGAYDISFGDVYGTICAHISPFSNSEEIKKLHSTIIWNIRVPRILLATLVGGALAIAGAAFQGCLRNPLVEPYILGVSSGAAFGAALAIVFPAMFLSIQISAFIFGGVAVTLAYMIARVRGETPVVTLILAGVIIGSVFMAFVSLMKYISDDGALREIVFWLMGGFYYASWEDIITLTPVVLICFGILWCLSWKINVLSMGDEEARALGVNPEFYKFIVIAAGTLVTAFAVSFVGIIAWVGLMMPHASRILLGPDNRFVIPAALMMGAIYMIICDTLARTLVGTEIPVGIITSILGAPYLCYLLRNKGGLNLG